MFKRKPKEPGYKVTNLGNLIVECTQMPHSLHEEDDTVYKILTWRMSLTVKDGPELMSRTYVKGTDEAIDKLNSFLKPMTKVKSQFMAQHLFYAELYNAWSLDEDLGR